MYSIAMRKYYKRRYPRLFKSDGRNTIFEPSNFTPVFNSNAYELLKKLISSSSNSILILTYDLHIKKPHTPSIINSVISLLKFKREQGLDVRIIINGKYKTPFQSSVNYQSYKYLKQDGFNIVSAPPSRLLHSKLIISDKRKVFLGSHNLTATSLKENFEASILINSILYAAPYVEYFENIWNEVQRENCRKTEIERD